ncbi:MAG: hemolysin secretion protein D [Candidatus Cloacimonadota bacterium]|nr:MAG: hemolysin secretion protein D [Candidatus Cloacimonadota bacterium]
MSLKDLQCNSETARVILNSNPTKSRLVVYLVAISTLWVIVWACYAEVDEITRGEGKIIPSSKIQVIQNLEGGLIDKILVKPGDFVIQGQVLVRIKNKRFEGDFSENSSRIHELKLKTTRLKAESQKSKFIIPKEMKAKNLLMYQLEKNLFDSHNDYLSNQIAMVYQQIDQKNKRILEVKSTIKYAKNNLRLLQEQISFTAPLVEKGIESKIEMIRLKRDKEGLLEKIETSEHILERLKSELKEADQKIKDTYLGFKNRSQKELSEALSELQRLKGRQENLRDRVTRTEITSPVKGRIKQLFIHTLGGVIKPGADILEILPTDDVLLIEAKIKPSDVAFLYPGLEALVKVSAYDFSIFGGLKGRVISIGADTIEDRRGNPFYLVQVSTDKNYLGTNKDQKKLMAGMVVSLDIITGKKRIIDYLLKPLLKARQNALTER